MTSFFLFESTDKMRFGFHFYISVAGEYVFKQELST